MNSRIKDFVQSCGVLNLSQEDLEDFQQYLYELQREKEEPEKIKVSEEIKLKIQKDFDILAKFFPYKSEQDIFGYADDYYSNFHGFHSEENLELKTQAYIHWTKQDEYWEINYEIMYSNQYLSNNVHIRTNLLNYEPGHLTEKMVQDVIGEIVSWLKNIHKETETYLEKIGEEIK